MKKEVREFLKDKFQELKLVGLGVAICKDSKIYTYAFGKSNLESNSFIDHQSIFNIASVGKLLTTVAILQLVEKRHLSIETQIGTILPSLPSDWRRVKVKHLLSHTSGIKNYTDTREYWAETRLDVSPERIMEYVEREPLLFPPGSAWTYNNTGFYLLGFIIEAVTGMPYFDFVLQITSTYKAGLQIVPTDYAKIIKGRVVGYRYDKDALLNVPYYSPSGTFAAGGFSANLSDFLDFEDAVFNGRVVDKTWAELLSLSLVNEEERLFTSTHPLANFEITLGLFKTERNGKTLLAHGGQIAGFSTSYLRCLEDNFSVIISTNTENVELLQLVLAIEAINNIADCNFKVR